MPPLPYSLGEYKMRLLAIHSDFVEFEAKKKAMKEAEEMKDAKKRFEECLVVFTAVEKRDETNTKTTVARYVEEIKNIASQVKTDTIVLYPYVHLTSTPSNPSTALKVLKEAEKVLKAEKFKVDHSPFGWYKAFDIKCKGHPLSELSREFGPDEEAEEIDMEELLKKMSKIRMSAPRGKKDLKSNVELGRDLDLYIVNEIVGGGLPLFTPKGTTIKREIERFTVDEELKRGYLHTSTPIMAKSDLYKISGHWQHYKDDMFTLNIRGDTFALRPMTCPFQFVLYKRKPRSYKELPKRYAEISQLFRNEKSGELRGLTRVRQFTLSDAHIICRPKQLKEEFEKVLDLINFLMEKLGITDTWYRFSKWDPKDKGKKYIDNPEAWEDSQKTMKNILDKLKLKYKEADGEAAFYGPKLDLQYYDVYGKEDTLITVQIDFALPEKFGLTYLGEDNKEKRPMIIHRSSMGATERTIAYLLEKTQGKLPLWLNPVQVKVLTITDKQIAFAKDIVEKMNSVGLRVELDERTETMGKKVREAQLEKVNYIVTVGEKEVEKNTLAIRTRAGEVKFGVDIEELINSLVDEVKNKEIK